MKRRALLAALGVAPLLRPGHAAAQGAAPPVVGFVHAGVAATRVKQTAGFLDGLRQAGPTGRNAPIVEFRWAEGHYERLEPFVAALIARKVTVIVAGTLAVAVVAKRMARDIPILFVSGDDPVKQGLVESFGRPGGNSTGVAMMSAELVGKRLDALHQVIPSATEIALLVNPGNPGTPTEIADTVEAARARGMRVTPVEARTPGEIEAVFAGFARKRPEGLVCGADPFLSSQAAKIVDLVARHAIPTIYEWPEFVEAGGLMSYAPDLVDVYFQLGRLAGKVLSGARPADLPIIRPTKFDLLISLKTARALGLTLPPTLLAQADEIIE